MTICLLLKNFIVSGMMKKIGMEFCGQASIINKKFCRPIVQYLKKLRKPIVVGLQLFLNRMVSLFLCWGAAAVTQILNRNGAACPTAAGPYIRPVSRASTRGGPGFR